jgi:hypothetical protein
MPRIFISYRREDSAGHAGRLNDRLKASFGDGQVFMDLEDIALGANFVQVLQASVDAADVALILIGPDWLGAATADGRRRLEDPSDFVRQEVAASLARGKRVVPVLLNGTPMPRDSDLPADLKPLALRQALEVSDAHFDRDTDLLIGALGGQPASLGAGRKPPRAGYWLSTAAAVAIAALATWQVLISPRLAQSPGPEPASTPVPAQAEIAGTWEGDVTYEWGDKHRETFRFSRIAGAWTGTASFLGAPRGILSIEVTGNTVAFTTRSQEVSGGATHDLLHRYRGEITGDAMRLVMQIEGGSSSGVPSEIVARRIAGR